MKYSYKWIKELSGTTKTVDEIAQLLLTHSFEIESIDDMSKGLEKVVIGEVLTKEQHPDADRLHVATVHIGAETLQIVCGAPNLEAGQKVPVALIGSELPCGLTIKKNKIRGVESNGMICAEDELGISNNHDTIIVLNPDAPIGGSFTEYTGRNDAVIDIKILPNRGHDCLSHIGIANEIRALEGKSPIVLNGIVPDVATQYDVTIDTKKCNRYIAVAMDGVQNRETPQWIVDRLRVCGVKSINAVVDITNYVMLETGQPLHAFSADHVKKILVRQAQEGEKIMLLDDTEKTLTQDDMVITDGVRPIAIAGVMGGKESGITEATSEIVLESASFDAPTIRYTQRRHNLLTDAAFRYERDIDPNLTAYATERAVALLSEVCHAHVVAVRDIYPLPVKEWGIELSLSMVSKLLGADVAEETITDILVRLGMQIQTTEKNDTLVVTVPTIRRDLTTQEDLIEEIGRVYGYEKITKKPLQENISTPKKNELRQCERTLMDACIASGFDEIKGYSFYAREDAKAIGLNDENHVAVLNPLTPEHAVMRRSLMPELCRAIKKNLSYFPEIRLCDIGRIYDPTKHVLPDEKLVLGFAVASREIDGSQFYEIKGLIENICTLCNIGEIYFDDVFDENEEHIPNLHPSRRALVRTTEGKALGWVGEVAKKTQKFYGIKRDRVAVGELNIVQIFQEMRAENFYAPLVKYPIVTRDLSLLVPQYTRVADIERVIYASGGTNIKDVDVFDIYDNAETEERSLAFHIIFGADDRTLASEEVDVQIMYIIEALEKDDDITVRR
ncbi:MAG: phenylalanine--tRNA ligase subunit beta [Parcubacteria group bacterium]|jgi:phenylalanyl-tRNA synthetase beta chain